MRKNLHIFVDPKTQRPLRLITEEVRDGHVISGRLSNSRRNYPVLNGIPRFVTKEFYSGSLARSGEKQTAHSFGDKWREKRSQRYGHAPHGAKSLREQFMAVLGCRSAGEVKTIFNKSKCILNAGCGVAWSESLFDYNPKAKKHCVDISLSVETAYRNTERCNNVIVSQASISELPYRDETFDIIYSIGVLHHTPAPHKMFMSLARKLAPAGLLGIYIYNKKPFIREIVDREIRKITTTLTYEECMKFSKQMTRLGKALGEVKGKVLIRDNIGLLDIRKGKYSIQEFMYNYFLKCWYNPKSDAEYADLVNQDWYHPYYASHHTKEEVIRWFRACGIRDLKCIQPKGWEHSGYFISGRKK